MTMTYVYVMEKPVRNSLSVSKIVLLVTRNGYNEI